MKIADNIFEPLLFYLYDISKIVRIILYLRYLFLKYRTEYNFF